MLYFTLPPAYSLSIKEHFTMNNRQNLNEHIHFIGIGGSSMSGLAELAVKQGYTVSGSDRSDSSVLDRLRALGVHIYLSQSAENITDDISLVIYTLAVPDSNPELAEARRRNIDTVERGIYLGKLAEHYKYSVAVAGTHGKTTVTSMLSSIFISDNKEPNIHIGGTFHRIGGSVQTSDSEYFITEACEYHENFLNIHPFAGIILNVEAEHLDYYRDFDHIRSAFSQFASSCSKDGFLVVCKDSAEASDAALGVKCPVITYSIKDPSAMFYAADIRHKENKTYYTLTENGKALCEICLNVPGIHNISNSLAAASAAIRLGCSPEGIADGIYEFHGAGRRFEQKGTFNGAPVIDDYAHHPTEIAAVLSAAREVISDEGKIIAVFQPHTYSRAMSFQKEFSCALKNAETVIVTEIYSAREKDPGTISGASMAEYFVQNGVNAVHISDFKEIAKAVRASATSNDIVITLGAGNVNQVIDMILES